MTATTKTRAPIERTEHPHIVRSADTLSGKPRIADTRIGVHHVFAYVAAGRGVAEIQDAYPDLTLAEIYDALSYAYDHPDEMAEIAEANKLWRVLKDNDLVYVPMSVGSRLVPRHQFDPAQLPAGTAYYTWDTLPEHLR